MHTSSVLDTYIIFVLHINPPFRESQCGISVLSISVYVCMCVCVSSSACTFCLILVRILDRHCGSRVRFRSSKPPSKSRCRFRRALRSAYLSACELRQTQAKYVVMQLRISHVFAMIRYYMVMIWIFLTSGSHGRRIGR